jgi:hypothetical protein
LGNVALVTVRLEGEKLLAVLCATFGRTVRITVAAVNSLLENAIVPAIEHIGVVSVPSIVTVREDKRLVGVLRLVTVLVELSSVPVDLHEHTRNVNRVIGVQAIARIGASRSESNMGLVVRGIEVLAVPAAGEVDLRTDAGGAELLGER